MKSTTQLSYTFRIALLACTLLFSSCSGEVTPEASNKVTILIDGSGSFQNKQQDAINRVSVLLDSLAQKKLHRWELNSDQIIIISLDAIPEVIWNGSIQDLKDQDRKSWEKRFESRTDYAGCTDVTTAFRIATQHLDGDPRYIHKYLFVFSDLLHEPPNTSVNQCYLPSKTPRDEFPWQSLADVSVSVFWMPPDQKLAWRREALEHDVDSNFALFTASESDEVTIKPPPAPAVELMAEELEAEREEVRKLGENILKGSLFTTLGAVVLFLLSVILLLIKNKRKRGPTTHKGSVSMPLSPPRTVNQTTQPPTRPPTH